MRAVASPKNIAGAERLARDIAHTEKEIAYYLDRLDIIDETVAQGFDDQPLHRENFTAAVASLKRRIVSKEWIARSTATIRELRCLHYGYFWWRIDLPYNDRKLRAFYAAGNGGQVVMVVPALDLVVTIMAAITATR